MKEIILKAENLYFSYEGETSHSLNGLSLEIERGKKVAFMGANGSGKSTFFLCCNGILKPTKGRLYLEGKPYDYTRKGLLSLRQKVGIVFQDPDNQLFSASVYQEISFGILNLGVSKEEAAREVEAVIEELEITPFRHKPTHALSGGQKKQVSIADILVMHPDIMILDEPGAALDPRHTAMVNGIVDRLTEQGITVLMATHDVDYAMRWADQVFLFKEGKVLASGTPMEVFSNKTVLRETNLEPPAVLELFHTLCKKDILSPNLPIPRKLSELEAYISALHEPSHGRKSREGSETKRAILTVSFGTSYEEARKAGIDAIEEEFRKAFPDLGQYRAWTSKRILEKLKRERNVWIPNVTQAMEQMRADGITDVVIQPTHVINGIENEQMKADALAFRDDFSSISFGTPLLTSEEDNDAVIRTIAEAFSFVKPTEALILMGHGTSHYSNAVYAALDYAFKEKGYPNIFLGTVEAYPTMETLLKMAEAAKPEKIYLAPFMIVAGDHARKDMAGKAPDSWMRQLQEKGFETVPVLKGLGEYEGIRRIFVRHAKAAVGEGEGKQYEQKQD